MSCSERQKSYGKPHKQVEFTTEEIKDQRKQFADDIVQPFNKGIFSKEYYDKHGTKGIQVSDQEIKNAKEVWIDDKYYS